MTTTTKGSGKGGAMDGNRPKLLFFTGRCRSCNRGVRGVSSGQAYRLAKANPGRTGDVFEASVGNVFDVACVDCPTCGKPARVHNVRAVLSVKHKCGARCLSSTGHDCTCSCGGANHGAAA